MLALRKIIIRQSWLLVAVVFTLLVQVQQALACEMMFDTSAPAEDRCYKHDAVEENQTDTTEQTCCDYSVIHTVNAGFCNDGHETTINNQLLGKLNPDFHPVTILINPQYIFTSLNLTALLFVPDRKSSQPGTRTYLSTQRLRI